MNQTVSTSAPGKIILTGEHFVVHGSYSIAAAINKRVKVTIRKGTGASRITSGNVVSKIAVNDGKFIAVKTVLKKVLEKRNGTNIEVIISSEIPSGSGLGSSAAASVAVGAAALKLLDMPTDQRTIFEMAMQGEKAVHGNPSGIDIEASLQGGLLLFKKNAGAKSIPLERSLQLLVAYSGKRRNTSSLIARVAVKKRAYPHIFESLTNASSFLTLSILDSIKKGDLPRLGALMNLSQAALSWLGVSNATLERMIDCATTLGVFGAKLTGAGGGGSIIILPKPETTESVLRAISKRYSSSFLTTIPQQGLLWDQ